MRWLLALWLLHGAAAQADTVRAEDYDAFWLWSGVAAQPVLAQARSLYVLQGQISASRHGGVRLIAQGIAIPRLTRGEVWVVYRAHTLRWSEDIHRTLLAQLRRWRRAGNPVVGVQIDFDARTRYLGEYAAFLRDFRQKLPPDYKLSITGLLDWSSNAEPEAINQLRGVVDEVVVQTYQGRHSIPDYAAYLPRVSRLQLPFRIGLAQYGQWQAPDYLARSPWFRGYVVFLQNPARP
ncbi:DUF3142 domain-containing protein [Pseudomonas schmalbachii]|uniref:DUF3142 domain-containing protein n=1 Tax=Pseudomonas schmalbachii TaxID=2816993 RepID=A0ABS3TQT6_9PSED|nr:DUF3142 domain-containing protein [Pseudomonas schmalbachii]MBO3276018.1 DUF3142 domain-containing protein [Pseudomonas schmalbachii]